MTKKFFSVVVIFLVTVTGVGIFIKNHPSKEKVWLSHPLHGFRVLDASSLPTGQRITDRRIMVTKAKSGNARGVTVEYNLRTEDWVYSIVQSRLTSAVATSIHTTHDNYDAASISATCTQRSLPKHRSYRLCHWIDYGRISVFEVTTALEATFLQAEFPASIATPIPVAELDRFVNTLAPGDTSHVRVEQSSF